MSTEPAADECTTLYRPVGPKELELIVQSGYHRFPPRLEGQPFFYPVMNEEYARQIARDWNAIDPSIGRGFATRFCVNSNYLSCFEIQTVGRAVHKELWVPAADLAEFNRNIVGTIEVIADYP